MNDPRQFQVGDVIQLKDVTITIDDIAEDNKRLYFYGPNKAGGRDGIIYDKRLPVRLCKIELVN